MSILNNFPSESEAKECAAFLECNGVTATAHVDTISVMPSGIARWKVMYDEFSQTGQDAWEKWENRQ
jgi:hypothetical protein